MAKFKSADSFFPYDNLYLLPLTFERLSNNRYLVANAVGEFGRYTRQELCRLQELDFSSADELYLRASKQMLIGVKGNKSTLQILAARMRSRMRFVTQETALHLFVVTLRCEHSCPYCQVSRSSESAPGRDMSTKIADESIKLAFCSSNPHIKIEFQGGEPLLNFDLIKYIVKNAKKEALQKGKSVDFVITTNLALLTTEMLEFFKDEDIFISTSLDGPEYIHNANRPRPGSNSYQLAVAGIKRIQNEIGRDKVSALMTTTHRSIKHVQEIIDEYVELGFRRIFLRPLSPHGFAVKTKYISKYNDEEFLEFWKAGLSYILDLNKRGIYFSETYTTILLKKILTDDSVNYMDLRSPTSAGIGAIVYNYDGKVYASDESRMLGEVGDDSFVLGRVGEISFKDLLLQDKLISLVRETATQGAVQCESCAFQSHCGADPVYHYATQHDFVGVKSISGFCYRQKATISYLHDLLVSSPEDASILKSWVL